MRAWCRRHRWIALVGLLIAAVFLAWAFAEIPGTLGNVLRWGSLICVAATGLGLVAKAPKD